MTILEKTSSLPDITQFKLKQKRKQIKKIAKQLGCELNGNILSYHGLDLIDFYFFDDSDDSKALEVNFINLDKLLCKGKCTYPELIKRFCSRYDLAVGDENYRNILEGRIPTIILKKDSIIEFIEETKTISIRILRPSDYVYLIGLLS